jgi:hypothetical protein
MKSPVMASTQMVKTLMLQGTIAFSIDQDPGPLLLIGYKDDDVIEFSKRRLAPMIRDMPVLQSKLISTKARDSNNSLDYKVFSNGASISLVGSLSANNLGQRTIQKLLADEVDQYPMSVDKQGHAIDIAYRRVAQFGSRYKVVLVSSPTFKGRSRIGKAFPGRRPALSLRVLQISQRRRGRLRPRADSTLAPGRLYKKLHIDEAPPALVTGAKPARGCGTNTTARPISLRPSIGSNTIPAAKTPAFGFPTYIPGCCCILSRTW